MLFWQGFSKAGGRAFLEAGSGRGFLHTPYEHPYIFGVDARFKSGLDMVWIPALFQSVMGNVFL